MQKLARLQLQFFSFFLVFFYQESDNIRNVYVYCVTVRDRMSGQTQKTLRNAWCGYKRGRASWTLQTLQMAECGLGVQRPLRLIPVKGKVVTMELVVSYIWSTQTPSALWDQSWALFSWFLMLNHHQVGREWVTALWLAAQCSEWTL